MLLEDKLNSLENKLSVYSLFPVVLPGLAKLGLGLIQTISALAISIIFAIPSCLQYSDSQKLFCRAFKHIFHGIGNITAGGLEAIPIIGTIFFGIRVLKVLYSKNQMNSHCTFYLMMTHPAFKFLPYENNKVEVFLKAQQDLIDNRHEN
jgi:hypothetical protein